jgi:hypothetical protein
VISGDFGRTHTFEPLVAAPQYIKKQTIVLIIIEIKKKKKKEAVWMTNLL